MTVNFTFFIQFVVIFWMLPIIFIVFSKKVAGNEKLVWVLAALFVSWFAFLFYILLAPIKKRHG